LDFPPHCQENFVEKASAEDQYRFYTDEVIIKIYLGNVKK